MLICYTLSKDNLISKGIAIKTDLINKCKYISSEGSNNNKYIRLYFNPEESRVYKGELFNKVFKESDKDVNIRGTLVALNWSNSITGGELNTDISKSIEKGHLKIISSAKRFEGLTLDFRKEIYTTTYIVEVTEECEVKYKSSININSKLEYSNKDNYKIILRPDKEPRVININ